MVVRDIPVWVFGVRLADEAEGRLTGQRRKLTYRRLLGGGSDTASTGVVWLD